MSATAATQPGYPLTNLLERAGARLRGRGRADCPRCGARRAVSFTDELFCCHHAGCDFRGNQRSLAKTLGLSRSITREEARALRRRQFREKWAAQHVRARRLTLVEELHQLQRIIDGATRRGQREPENDLVWRGLDLAYLETDQVRAELCVLENCSAIEAAAFLASKPEVKEAAIRRVIQQGGIVNSAGTFRDVDVCTPGVAR